MARKKIIDLVLIKKAQLNAGGAAGAAAAEENTRLALAAIHGGVKSPAWKTYMEQFVNRDANGNLDPEQLARLTANDGTGSKPDLIKNRAYLVSNGSCGLGTRDRFDQFVKTIDQDIEADCEPTPQ